MFDETELLMILNALKARRAEFIKCYWETNQLKDCIEKIREFKVLESKISKLIKKPKVITKIKL